jgi:hypothetical protein
LLVWRSATLRSGSIIAASKTRRRKGMNLLPKIIGGVRFQDRIEVIEMPANHATGLPRPPRSHIALRVEKNNIPV